MVALTCVGGRLTSSRRSRMRAGERRTTAMVVLSLSAARAAWPDLADRVDPLRRSAARMAAERWSPNPQALAIVDFRVATWDGPAATRLPWEWPLDPLVVQMLSDIEEAWDDFAFRDGGQCGLRVPRDRVQRQLERPFDGTRRATTVQSLARRSSITVQCWRILRARRRLASRSSGPRRPSRG